MAVSPTRAALVPTSASQLNLNATDAGSSKKRKRTDQENGSILGSIFVTKAISSAQRPASATFVSITTIPRTSLPLAWLDPCRTSVQPPPGYVFSTDSSILKLKEQVVIARLSPNGALYAIESAGHGAYTAWPLLNWVSEELCCNADNGRAVFPGIEDLTRGHGGHSKTGSLSGDSQTPLPIPLSPRKAKNRRGAMARMSILTTANTNDTSPSIDVRSFEAALVGSPQDTQDAGHSATLVPTTIPSAGESAMADPSILSTEINRIGPNEPAIGQISTVPTQKVQLDAERLHQQYLETLYLSQASLAFWAKGPLSRARAQSRQPGAEFGLEALQECYISTVLPNKKLDLKYRDSISTAVKKLYSNNEQDEKLAKPVKRKNSKKFKLGKDGLYTGEEEMIGRWWNSRDLRLSPTPDASANDSRKAIADLRNRETEMQLLLILEVLYIESLLAKAMDTAVHSDPQIKLEPMEEDSAALQSRPARINKKRDLNGELDATAERLSIWHTVALEDMLSSPEKAREEGGILAAKSKDKLRDFCRDVIIPFYSVKLPEQAKSICRKLGGPETSPQRPRSNSSKTVQRPATSAGTKPISRPTLKRSLQRVLSEDQTARHASPPVLSRAATLSHVPSLKREASETETRPMSRSIMQKSVSFSNREIDLVADAKAHDAKKRKLDKLSTQKRELEQAIDALKKPNRTHAARVLMDEIEKRNVDAKIGTTKADGKVHITATPRRGKARLSSSQSLHEQNQIPSIEVNPIVPSSTLKAPSQTALTIPASSKKKRAVLSAIHDTPSRGATKLSNPLATVEATPASNRIRPDFPTDTPISARLTTKSQKPVLFTPVKRKDINDADAVLFRDVPEIPEKAGKAMDRVMGGKGIEPSIPLDFSFVDAPDLHKSTVPVPTVPTATVTEDARGRGNITGGKSLYEQLGWDDYDDV